MSKCLYDLYGWTSKQSFARKKTCLPQLTRAILYIFIKVIKIKIFLMQGHIPCGWGLLASWFGEERLSHQIHYTVFQWSTLMWDREKGSICSWSSICFIHWYYLGVLLHQLFQGQGKFHALWWRSWGWNGIIQVSLVVLSILWLFGPLISMRIDGFYASMFCL